eukprot:8007753-Lingulodinium_polyedra.AAC.1
MCIRDSTTQAPRKQHRKHARRATHARTTRTNTKLYKPPLAVPGGATHSPIKRGTHLPECSHAQRGHL